MSIPAAAAATAGAAAPSPPLKWSEEPETTWSYQDLTVNYVARGPEDGTPMLLIHGFGASSFHWRSDVNALADEGYRVYAIDLLGFGLSSKPVIDYSAETWRDQCGAFLREVAGCGVGGRKAIVCGNSIGGNCALCVAATYPELVLGCASLNGAGAFAPSPAEVQTRAALEAERATRGPVRVAVDAAVEELPVSLQRLVAYLGLIPFVCLLPILLGRCHSRVRQCLRPSTPPSATSDEAASRRSSESADNSAAKLAESERANKRLRVRVSGTIAWVGWALFSLAAIKSATAG